MNKKITTALLSGALLLTASFNSINAHELTETAKNNAKIQQQKDREEYNRKKKQTFITSKSNKRFDVTKGYNSKIEAIFVALTNIDCINKGYEIAKGKDGKFYIKLLTEKTYNIYR